MSAESFKHPLIISHADCPDGFAAAWAAHRFFKTTAIPLTEPPEFKFQQYGHDFDIMSVAGRDLYILDFSFPREMMVAIQATANSMVVLEHHKTAEAELAGLGPTVHFDNDRSGCGMAWDHFHGSQRPWMINYVEDRDLWRKELEWTEEVNAYLGTRPYTFDAWDYMWDNCGNRITPDVKYIEAGRAVVDKIAQYCREAANNVMMVTFEGYKVPLVNANQVNISELLHRLCKVPIGSDTPAFSMGWWQMSNGQFKYSLRSLGNFDVSELAKKHGGGGHMNAAGFQANGPIHMWW